MTTAFVPRVFLALSFILSASSRSHLKDFGLREAEAGILGQTLDCNNLDQCEDTTGRRGFICATNGFTYKSLCSYMKAFCIETEVAFKHHGECTASEKCLGLKTVALKKAKTKKGVYIPTCNSDGTFAPVQCHKDSNFCWCATPTGTSISGTQVLNEAPKCDNLTGSHSSSASWKKSNGRRVKGGCNGHKRKTFNIHFLQKMLEEFWRINNITLGEKQLQIAALKWKFLLLDKRPDGKLSRSEYKGIQKLVRGNFIPKKCAKKFPKFCDKNADKKISLNEWLKCFPTDRTVVELFEGNIMNNSKGKKGSKSVKLGMGPVTKPRPNCNLDQQQAQEIFHSGNNDVYIPQCESNGRYKAVQCYGSIGKNQWYCFCVNVITGEMIQNTSVQNIIPECSTNLLPKPWPKCPAPDKEKKFLKALIAYFSKLIKSNIMRKYHTKTDVNEEKSILEKVFMFSDKNKNGVLEGKERKKLKSLLKGQKGLWKCGKKIHKVCDIDFDGKISLHEFHTCILPRKSHALHNLVSRPIDKDSFSRRKKGKNPFIEIITPE